MWSSIAHRHLILSSRRNICCTAAVRANASANHYDVLGITPKATQAEVKAAYYKLSKLHHPDTSDNEKEDGDKFRLITEAYDVLGNYRTRQLYDKGLYGHFRSAERKKDGTPDHPQMKFYKSRLDKARVPSSTPLHNIYNFDEWTKQHYSELINKQIHRVKQSTKDRHHKEVHMDESHINIGVVLGLALFAGFLAIFVSEQGHDSPRPLSKTMDKPA